MAGGCVAYHHGIMRKGITSLLLHSESGVDIVRCSDLKNLLLFSRHVARPQSGNKWNKRCPDLSSDLLVLLFIAFVNDVDSTLIPTESDGGGWTTRTSQMSDSDISSFRIPNEAAREPKPFSNSECGINFMEIVRKFNSNYSFLFYFLHFRFWIQGVVWKRVLFLASWNWRKRTRGKIIPHQLETSRE